MIPDKKCVFLLKSFYFFNVIRVFSNFFQVGKAAWKLVSKEDKIEKAREECILNVSAYVKANPRARPNEIQKKVQDEIEIFKAKIQ